MVTESLPARENEKAQVELERISHPIQLELDFGTLAHWFIPIMGVIYSAGFLIVFTFSKGFGIDGTEFFQGRYIHVGSLFVMACVVIALPVFWSTQVFGTSMTTGRLAWAVVAGLGIYSLMLFTFYMIVAFTERGFFHENAPLILANFVAPLAYSVLRYLLPAPIEDRKLRVLDVALASLFCAVQIVLTFKTLNLEVQSDFRHESLWSHLGAIFPLWPPSGVYGFVLLMVLNVMYASLAVARWRQAGDTRSRLMILFSTVCVVGVLFYLGVLTFAYAVYPYISSAKGGGGYVDAPTVRVLFQEPITNPNDVRSPMAADNSAFIILYESSESIFLASKDDKAAGDPSQWQRPGSPKPKVYELRREFLSGVIYSNATPAPR